MAKTMKRPLKNLPTFPEEDVVYQVEGMEGEATGVENPREDVDIPADVP
jgi:hypothetical protein